MKLQHQYYLISLVWILTTLQPELTYGIQEEETHSGEPPRIELWPMGLPMGAKALSDSVILKQKEVEKRRSGIVAYVANPLLTVHPASEKLATGCAMIVCPGGGYNILAWEKEGVEIARYLNTKGISAFVLKYRVPRRDPQEIYQEPLQDAQRAIRVVRSQAGKWNIDPNRIGLMGFSAGGHLTVMAATKYASSSYPRIDDVDDISCRPDFVCPIYAAYLGPEFKDNEPRLDPDLKLTQNTPPMFLAVTGDDKMRGAQAALLYVKLRELNVPAELHVYSRGGHGYGIRQNNNPVGSWHLRMTEWIASEGWLMSK